MFRYQNSMVTGGRTTRARASRTAPPGDPRQADAHQRQPQVLERPGADHRRHRRHHLGHRRRVLVGERNLGSGGQLVRRTALHDARARPASRRANRRARPSDRRPDEQHEHAARRTDKQEDRVAGDQAVLARRTRERSRRRSSHRGPPDRKWSQRRRHGGLPADRREGTHRTLTRHGLAQPHGRPARLQRGASPGARPGRAVRLPASARRSWPRRRARRGAPAAIRPRPRGRRREHGRHRGARARTSRGGRLGGGGRDDPGAPHRAPRRQGGGRSRGDAGGDDRHGHLHGRRPRHPARPDPDPRTRSSQDHDVALGSRIQPDGTRHAPLAAWVPALPGSASSTRSPPPGWSGRCRTPSAGSRASTAKPPRTCSAASRSPASSSTSRSSTSPAGAATGMAIVPIQWSDKRGSRMHPRAGLALRVAWDLFRIPLIHRGVRRRH